MKSIIELCAAGILMATAGSCLATVHYVDVNSAAPAPPYTNWVTAAAVIQDAIDVSGAGDEIVVTNGMYATGGRALDGMMTNRVAVDKALTLRSANGPHFTIIQGYKLPGTNNGDGAIRCVYLANGAILSGFTLTNGATRAVFENAPNRQSSGGGVWCEFRDSVVITTRFERLCRAEADENKAGRPMNTKETAAGVQDGGNHSRSEEPAK